MTEPIQNLEVSFNAWTLLFLVTSSHGILLSLLLLFRKSATNRLLGWLVLSFSICIGFYIVFWTGYYRQLPKQLGVLQGLTFLFGPLIYAYLISNRKTTSFDYRNLIPFIGYVVLYLIVLPPGKLRSYILASSQIIHLFIYLFLIFRWLSSNKEFVNGALKRHLWQKKVAISFASYCFSFLLYYVLVWTGWLRIEYDYIISLAASFFIYFIGYHGFQHQEVLKMNDQSRYNKSSLETSASNAILNQLKKLMESEKPYLNASLKLQEVADRLGYQAHHISQVVNDLEEKNFPDFLNEYRISTAIKLLESTDYKVFHIAHDSGFNNKASFNNAFKKITGMSPGTYREIHRTNPQKRGKILSD